MSPYDNLPDHVLNDCGPCDGPMTEQELIEAHGVKVGQIWRRNAKVPLAAYPMEVVYVTVAFVVLHSTHRTVGLDCIPGIAGVEGRYASPFTESIRSLKSGRWVRES